MPDYAPPPRYDGRPHQYLLPADTYLWRIHSSKVSATDFTSGRTRQDRRLPRFAGTYADPFPSLHAGQDAAGILIECLLRGARRAPGGQVRTIRATSVQGQRITQLRTTAGLKLVSLLDSRDLDAVAQDFWLVHCEDVRHPELQRWTDWIRTQAPWATGFVWMARRTVRLPVVVLFGDRVAGDVFDPSWSDPVDLDNDDGAMFINRSLRRYGVRIVPPSERMNRRRGGAQSRPHEVAS